MEKWDRMCRLVYKLLCFTVVVATQPVLAGDWTVTNSLNLSSYYSDNLGQRADANAGMVVNASPQLALHGNGRRIKGALSYAPTLFTAFGDDPPDSGINHFLAAHFNSTLVRNTLFLDSTASAGLVTVNSAAGSDTASLSNTDDTSQTYSLSLSPYTRHRLGSYAELSFRLGLNAVRAESEASSLNSTGRSASASVSSGPRFARFPWSLSMRHNEVSFDDRTDTTDNLISSLGYRIDRRWRVDGKLGYQKSELATSRSDTSGMTYSAALYWTPNPRTRADAEFGRQYFGDFWRVHGEHGSRRTLLTLDLRREITNARNLLLREYTIEEAAMSSNERLVLDAASAEALANILGLDPDLIRIYDNVPIDEDYLSTLVSVGIRLTGKRTTVTAKANWNERSYEISSDTEEIMGLSIRGERHLGGRINAHASVSWQDVDSSISGTSQYWQLGIGASRSLGRHSRVSLDLSRQQRTSDGGSAAEFTEHRIGLTLTTRMF